MAARDRKPKLGDILVDGPIRAFVGLALLLPYAARVRFTGWVVSRVVAPLAGYRCRIRDNLALARPDLSHTEIEALVRSVPDNQGRSFIEIYSGEEFAARVRATDPLTGPGVAAMEKARSDGRPLILAVAHFGNYDAMRAALVGRGFTVGAVFRRQENLSFNRHYENAIRRIAEPMFPRDRLGLLHMLRFFKAGGMVAFVSDQHIGRGAELRFFGQPAMTTLNPAELAIKYGCDLVPIHAIRQPDGLSFVVRADAPIARDTPEAMMQAVNDNLEAVVRAHMDQWLWVHRRWKPARRQP